MQKIEFPSEYFNIKDTLECGQIFRFGAYKNGYLVFSKDKCAYVHTDNDKTVIECEDKDGGYFYDYFDLNRDYEVFVKKAEEEGVPILSAAAKTGKGIRILNQDKTEMLFSFIISQNNHIPRIKGIIERLSNSLGERRLFNGVEYYTFPSADRLGQETEEFYVKNGLGYRAEYMVAAAKAVNGGLDLEKLAELNTSELKTSLLGIKGVGPKVADCIALFGYHRADSFPVDTWIEKIYREDFGGELKGRDKITSYFTSRFQANSGYFQQYLFYYKRTIQNTK